MGTLSHSLKNRAQFIFLGEILINGHSNEIFGAQHRCAKMSKYQYLIDLRNSPARLIKHFLYWNLQEIDVQ